LAVRLDLAVLRWKNRKKIRIFDKNLYFVFLTKIVTLFSPKKISFFGCHNKQKSQNEECHTSLSSLFNFQSIGIST